MRFNPRFGSKNGNNNKLKYKGYFTFLLRKK